MNDYDDLDRALRALPLEEPPPGLHQAILAATVYRPAAPFKAWEVWLLGTLLALVTWLALAAHTLFSVERLDRIVHHSVVALRSFTLDDPMTLLWLGVGCSIAIWVLNLNIPAIGTNPRRHAR